MVTVPQYKHIATLLHRIWPPLLGGETSFSAHAYELVQNIPYNAIVAAIEDLQTRQRRPSMSELVDWARTRGWPTNERITPVGLQLDQVTAEAMIFGDRSRYAFPQTGGL